MVLSVLVSCTPLTSPPHPCSSPGRSGRHHRGRGHPGAAGGDGRVRLCGLGCRPHRIWALQHHHGAAGGGGQPEHSVRAGRQPRRVLEVSRARLGGLGGQQRHAHKSFGGRGSCCSAPGRPAVLGRIQHSTLPRTLPCSSMARRTLGDAGAGAVSATYLLLHFALLVACELWRGRAALFSGPALGWHAAASCLP